MDEFRKKVFGTFPNMTLMIQWTGWPSHSARQKRLLLFPSRYVRRFLIVLYVLMVASG